MMDILKERLYLAKGGSRDVFVEKCPAMQKQIDGIRFLYKVFVKKKPGLILNDPDSSATRIQVVLFINAIQHLLDKPILILCTEGREKRWIKTFEEWTGLAQEVLIETTDPFKRVSIGDEMRKVFVYVNPLENINLFSRREWSLLVIDNDVLPRDVLQAKLSGFKIWITDADVKKNLKTQFLPFYKWLYPKEIVDLEQFVAKSKLLSEVLDKEFMLQAFLEDILLRRDVTLPSNEDFNKDCNDKILTKPKVSRKNKDATGTKIKRSKRKMNELTESDIPLKVNKSNISVQNDTKENTLKSDNIKNTTKTTFDQKSDHQISNKSKTKSNDISYLNGNNEIIKQAHETKVSDISMKEDLHESINILNTNELLEMKTDELYHYNEVNDINTSDKTIIDEESNNSINLLEANELPELKFNQMINKNEVNDNNDVKNDSNDSMNLLESNSLPEVKVLDSIQILHENSGNLIDKNEIKHHDEVNKNLNRSDELNKSLNNLNPKDADFVKLISIEDSSNEISNKDIEDNLHKASNAKVAESENIFSTDEFNSVLKKNVSVDTKNEVDRKNEKTDLVNSNMSAIELKLKEMEENTLKKFKGSFLDRLF